MMEVWPAHGNAYGLVHPLAPSVVLYGQGTIEDLLQGGVQSW